MSASKSEKAAAVEALRARLASLPIEKTVALAHSYLTDLPGRQSEVVAHWILTDALDRLTRRLWPEIGAHD